MPDSEFEERLRASREMWKRIEGKAGPALRARVKVPYSLLENPLSEPERYAELVRPHWDWSVELVERDYLAALKVLERLRTVHVPRFEEFEARYRRDYHYLRDLEYRLTEEAATHGEDATLFQGLGLRPLTCREESGRSSVLMNGLRYQWRAELKDYPPGNGGPIKVEASDVAYWFDATEQPGVEKTGEEVLRIATGDRTFAEATEDVRTRLSLYGWGANPRLEQLRLRLAVIEAVVELYETEGEVERYDTAVAKAEPPEVSHAFKLAEDGDYCVERACNLIREHGLTLKAAHALLEEEVRGEYPERSPFFRHYDSIKDAFKTRGIKVRDLRGENGGSGGPELSP